MERVAKPEPGRQLARWNAPLCIRYDRLGAKFADFIQARIVKTAASIDVKIAKPGCPTAVLVKLTDYADELAKALVHMNPPRLGSVTSDTRPSKREIEAIETPRVVRWLTASATVNQDGMPITDSSNYVWSSRFIRSTTASQPENGIAALCIGVGEAAAVVVAVEPMD